MDTQFADKDQSINSYEYVPTLYESGYTWTGGLTEPSGPVCPTATTTYTVTATNAAGCQGRATTTVEALDIHSIDKNGKESKLKKPEDLAKYLAVEAFANPSNGA